MTKLAALSPEVRELVLLLQRDPMMSREEAMRQVGQQIGWWDWKAAHVAFYEKIGRHDLARIAGR